MPRLRSSGLRSASAEVGTSDLSSLERWWLSDRLGGMPKKKRKEKRYGGEGYRGHGSTGTAPVREVKADRSSDSSSAWGSWTGRQRDASEAEEDRSARGRSGPRSVSPCSGGLKLWPRRRGSVGSLLPELLRKSKSELEPEVAKEEEPPAEPRRPEPGAEATEAKKEESPARSPRTTARPTGVGGGNEFWRAVAERDNQNASAGDPPRTGSEAARRCAVTRARPKRFLLAAAKREREVIMRFKQCQNAKMRLESVSRPPGDWDEVEAPRVSDRIPLPHVRNAIEAADSIEDLELLERGLRSGRAVLHEPLSAPPVEGDRVAGRRRTEPSRTARRRAKEQEE